MHVHAHVYIYIYTYIKWMKIAFIIAHKRNNVLYLFGTLKVQSFIHMLKEKKAVSPDHQNPQPSIYIDKCTLYTYTVYMYTAL